MKINKSFYIEPHEKANIITESFGIDCGYENKICDIDIPNEYEILYITGESGSGKSTICNELLSNYSNEPIPYEKPLFLWNGVEIEQQLKMIEILCLVGLSDATIFINYYNNLSDSQKARARIVLELMSSKETIVIDEFLSTLDRKTAKAVAYCTQKAIRKYNKKAILVTAHDDLTNYIMPTYIIKGNAFPSRWNIEKYSNPHINSIQNKLVLKYGDKEYYKNLRLGELHYKGKYTGGTKEYLYALLEDECIGVLVSTYRMHDGGRRISRVVVHPSYRSCGVGMQMVKTYLKNFPNADVIAVMALFNPVFEKAGMNRVEDTIVKPPTGLKKDLININFDISKWFSKHYCNEFCKEKENRKIISKYGKNSTNLVQPGGKKLTIEEIETKILGDEVTAGRVLWGLRERKLAKYIGKGE